MSYLLIISYFSRTLIIWFCALYWAEMIKEVVNILLVFHYIFNFSHVQNLTLFK